MSTTHKRLSKNTHRSQRWLAALLVLIYLTQPVLTAVSAACAERSCGSGSGSEDCCCLGTPPPAVQPSISSGCCVDKQPADTAPTHPGARNCGCKTDSVPFPVPEPALPANSIGAVGNGSLVRWLDTHAECSAIIPCGPPGVHLPPGAWALRAGPGRQSGASGSPTEARVASAGAWSLLKRGVTGFLAVLSVARI